MLLQYAESDPEAEIRVKALGQELQKLGWIESRNLHVDYRWAGGNRDHFQRHAADLVKLGEEVIVAVSTPAAKELQRETRAIPIIFTQVNRFPHTYARARHGVLEKHEKQGCE